MITERSLLKEGLIHPEVNSIRIKRAAQLLRQKKMNVSEVGYSVGFSDVDYFRKCFKEEFGMTPREYVNLEDK